MPSTPDQHSSAEMEKLIEDLSESVHNKPELKQLILEMLKHGDGAIHWLQQPRTSLS